MKICIAGGTRPEWIKLAPVIKELQKRKIDFYILNTGQHYSHNMSDVFFKQLKLPEAKYNLLVGSSSHGQQTAEIIYGTEKVFKQDRPDVVVVEGDTNSVLGVALAASKMGIKVAHVEAGLRSWDKTMPEEINRILVDHIADLLFAPTPEASTNLLNECISSLKIGITGNTIVDGIKSFQKKIKSRQKNRILITLHRQENTEEKHKLEDFIKILERLRKRYQKWEIVYVAHPRTLKRLSELGLSIPRSIKILQSCGYLEFLNLLKSSKVVLTDSGGIQEEACILGVPCVTLRNNTERPETIQAGANRLAGLIPAYVLAMTKDALKNNNGWKQPFGDGKAAKKIVDGLEGR